MEDTQRNAKEREPHPLDKNFFSKLFFCWFPPFIIRGFKNEINEDNLYMTKKTLTSEYLSKKLEIAWDKELKKSKPSLLRALLSVFKCDLLGSGAWRIFLDMLKLSQPILIALLVSYFQSNQMGVNLTKIYICSALLISAATCQIIAIHQNMLLVLTLGMKIRIATCALIYRKALRLSKNVLADTKTGHIINLMSNDVGRFDVCCQFLHLLWLAPLEIAVVMILLYLYVSWTGLVGCVFLLAFIPFQPYMAKLASEYRLRTALCTDERVRLMSDILSGIQVIKMYTWEEPFALLVDRIRQLEVKQIQHISTIRAIMLSFSTVLSRLAVFICVFTFILAGFSLTAYFVFTVVSFYAFLRNSVILLFPQAVIQAAEAKISISRIENFLLTEEIENDIKQMSGDSLDTMSVRAVNEEDVGILIKNAAVKFVVSSPENVFKDVNFEATSNQLVGLIGPVGGGKSTLLHVILKEVVPFRGEVEVNGSVSYAAQEPWIFGGSIRQNILFGQTFNAEKYLKVVRVCALDRDLSMLPYGDKTILGERGVNLSGGQKARVNLARAVYKDADIYLLDDPLSAVDILVGNQLFHNCIRGYLKNKCVVLVTHQVQYLNSASSIYLLEDGIIRSSSTFEMLESNNKTFKELLESAKVETKRDVYRIRSKILNIDYESDQIPSVSVMTKEERATGAISKQVYKSYFTAGGHWSKTLGVFTAFVLAQVFGSSADVYLTYWVNAEQIEEESVFFHEYGLLFYTFLIVAAVAFAITRAVTFFKYTLRSSTILHNNMFKKVLYSPLSFFNTNPSGRILNRFSKDVGSLDETLPLCLVDTLAIGLTVLGITIVISIVNPWIMLPTMIIFAIMFYIKKCFLKSSRNIKRVEAVTRSPIYTHLTASLQGITTIRAFGAEEILCKEFDTLQDNCSSASYMFLAASRGFGFWLDLNCVTYISLVIISLLFIQRESFGGNVGLSLTQAITLAGMFQWGIRQWSELENQMTSVERVQEYIELPTELDYHKIKPIPSWPESGHIIFENVYLRYDPSSSYVLKDLNFEVRSGEKIGIVGRTGAGKSSIIQALFRLIDFEGFIIIDDLDTKTLKLKNLRSKISIIPQEPILFSGTLRKNLDPFGNYEDEVLWHVLEVVELKNAVDELPLGLDSKMVERGSNFSVGQRQLLCLARALVRNNKILVLDEATASVDAATDEIIQNTIREKFADCTVLTIAHRLHSIMDSDKILVMDSGRIVQFDHPYNLLIKGEGTFFRLVKETGTSTSSNLFSIAEENYLSKVELEQT